MIFDNWLYVIWVTCPKIRKYYTTFISAIGVTPNCRHNENGHCKKNQVPLVWYLIQRHPFRFKTYLPLITSDTYPLCSVMIHICLIKNHNKQNTIAQDKWILCKSVSNSGIIFGHIHVFFVQNIIFEHIHVFSVQNITNISCVGDTILCWVWKQVIVHHGIYQ